VWRGNDAQTNCLPRPLFRKTIRS